MRSQGVTDVVPVPEYLAAAGQPPLQSKWVDVSKGNFQLPVVRSRFVAE